jgi:ribose transport system substrate-binding protein
MTHPSAPGSTGRDEPAGISRRVVLQRAGLLTGGLFLGSAFLSACSSSSSSAASTSGSAAGSAAASATAAPSAAASFGPPIEGSADLASYKAFDPSVPAGGPTGLPKRVATNFPAGSAYFQDFEKNVKLAVESRGYEFTPTTWSDDIKQNNDQIDTLIESGIGAIIFQVQDEAGQQATIMKAINAGIGVIFSVAGPTYTQIIADQYQAGLIQGQQAAKWITANLGGKAQVVVFNDDQIAQALIPRGKGRVDGVTSAGSGVEVVANQSIQKLTAEEGQALANTILQKYPDANVWIGDDDTSIGVAAALKAAGKTPDDLIYVSGFNGQLNALQAVKDKTLFREDIAFPNSVYEYAAGMICCDWIESKSVPAIMNLAMLPVTPETADAFIATNSDPTKAYAEDLGKYVEYLGNTSWSSPTFIPTGIKTG